MKTEASFLYRYRSPGEPLAGPLRYAIGQCRFGRLLVASSAQGICAIFLGDEDRALQQQLRNAFVDTPLKPSQAGRLPAWRQVATFIDGDGRSQPMTLDLGGTAFQQKVWKTLCDIPAGQTRSYSEVALRAGMPAAVRAVAGACAANTVALAIPCHRVARADGSLSGYRWGSERKRRILAEEAA